MSSFTVDEAENESPPLVHSNTEEPIHLSMRNSLESPSAIETPPEKNKKKGKATKKATDEQPYQADTKPRKLPNEDRKRTKKVTNDSGNEKPKFTEKDRRETRTIDKMDSYMDDYLVPFHRTKTEMLEDDKETENVDNKPPPEAKAAKPRVDNKSKSKKNTKKSHKDNSQQKPTMNSPQPSKHVNNGTTRVMSVSLSTNQFLHVISNSSMLHTDNNIERLYHGVPLSIGN